MTLQAKAAGQNHYSDIATRTTSGTGVASAVVTPKTTTTYRWHYAGSDAHYSATSGGSVVHVAQVVTAMLSATSVARNKPVTVSGKVTPHENGQEVTLQYRSGSHWTVRTSAIIHNDAYTLKTTFGTAGTWSLRVVRAATAVNTVAVSPTVTLHTT